MSQYKLISIQHGLEGTAGTSVAATFKWKGNGKFKFLDSVHTPELDYATGVLGGNVEGAFIGDTGSELTLEDTEMSAENLIWLLNGAVKSVPGAASTFAFTFPTTSANTIKTFTWEFATASQEYEFAYGFISKFGISGDVNSNNGRMMVNAVVNGRAATASNATSSLGFLANHEPLNFNNAAIKIDAAGTAAGTASATAGTLKGFSLDCETGWTIDASRYADGRSAKDFSALTFTDYKLTGNLRILENATAVTQIANARAGTPIVVQILVNGSSSRAVKFNLPMVFTAPADLGNDSNGLHLLEFPFTAGYSRTSTAQGPEINITASASTTLS